MKNVLIIADIEGSSGCRDRECSLFLTNKWALACREMSLDVNAAADRYALLPLGKKRGRAPF